ncbi:MAG TPA: S1/P1 nuclease [Tepidisphaeraceae bacterium]|jgi:hypothetical protein
MRLGKNYSGVSRCALAREKAQKMLNRSGNRAMFLLVLLVVCSPVWAWNFTGHMSIGLLAWQKMDDATRQKVTEILKHHPHYKIYLSADVPQGVSVDEWAFIRAASWPDWVRPSFPGEAYKPRSITRYHHGEWHYIDIPYVVPGDVGKVKVPEQPSTMPTDQPTNAVQAMDHAVAVLADPNAKVEDKAVMLAWLEHLVGDIHQPLHATTEFSVRFRTGDKGGNAQGILVNGRVMNLHAYWDDALGTQMDYGTLAKVADEVNNDADAKADKLPQLQENRTPDAWARESYQLAVKDVYLNGTLQTAVYHRGLQDAPALPAGYAKNAHDLALKRAALASDRLSELLGELMK